MLLYSWQPGFVPLPHWWETAEMEAELAAGQLCQSQRHRSKRLGFDDDRPKMVIFESLLI
jgi:hypothetical protein